MNLLEQTRRCNDGKESWNRREPGAEAVSLMERRQTNSNIPISQTRLRGAECHIGNSRPAASPTDMQTRGGERALPMTCQTWMLTEAAALLISTPQAVILDMIAGCGIWRTAAHPPVKPWPAFLWSCARTAVEG